MVRNYRKPLVIVGPKTLLRHPAAVSPLSSMTPGTHFQPVLQDPAAKPDQCAFLLPPICLCP
jgi:probable 2-oxoglutarate dehydrogenase E1 component DHKTD1